MRSVKDMNESRQNVLDNSKDSILGQLQSTATSLKSLKKLAAKNQGGSKRAGEDALSLVEVGGLPLHNFIRKQSRHKVQTTKLVNEKFLGREAEPRVFREGSAVERIRHQDLVKNYNRKICLDRCKKVEEEVKRIEYKETHKKKTLLDISKKAGKPVYASMFPNRYVRAELPCTIEHGGKGQYLSWACPLDNLDYTYYLPVFFDGLQVDQPPSDFLARQGVEDLLLGARGHPERIIPCLKACARFLRNALATFKPAVVLGTFKAIQQLVKVGPGVGEALMPYGKLFLGPIAAFLDMSRNIGDQIDYGQRRNDDIGEEALKTLEYLEENGGPRAYECIKNSIPTYKSCIHARK